VRSVPAPSVLGNQANCTAGRQSIHEWIQGVLDSENYEAARRALGILYLQGHQAVVLGSEAGDDTICAALYSDLAEVTWA
jgi:hypothetical protein